MDYILGVVLSLFSIVFGIWTVRVLYVNTTRKVVALSSVSCFAVMSVISDNLSSILNNQPKFIVLIISELFCCLGFFSVFGIITAIFFYGRKPKQKKNSGDFGKVMGTIILVIVGLLCAGTGVLSPITYGCGSLIKKIWKN